MCNVLKYRKIFKNGSVRLRCGCGAVAFIFFNLLQVKPVLYDNIKQHTHGKDDTVPNIHVSKLKRKLNGTEP